MASSPSRPVLLVHGYLATPTVMLPLKWRLARRGLDAHLVSLSPLCIGDVRDLAVQLADNVARVRRDTGAERVDLIGVSLGGFIALTYLNQLRGEESVGRFVAVASPFQGTWAAVLGVATLGAISPGAWQLLPTSELVSELALPQAVPTVSISMDGDLMAPPHRCHLPGATNIRLDRPWYPSALVHQGMTFHTETIDHIMNGLDGG